MRSKHNLTFSLGLILNLLVCCCAAVAGVTRSLLLSLPVLTSLTAQSSAPAQPKPLPAPTRWRGLIGEDGPGDNILIILEKDGRLFPSFNPAEPEPLAQSTRNLFKFLAPAPLPPQR